MKQTILLSATVAMMSLASCKKAYTCTCTTTTTGAYSSSSTSSSVMPKTTKANAKTSCESGNTDNPSGGGTTTCSIS